MWGKNMKNAGEKIRHGKMFIKHAAGSRTLYGLEGAEGEMLCWDIYPGIQICFNNFRTEIPLPCGGQDRDRTVMEMNFCIDGRHECEYADRTVSVLKQREFCINLDGNAVQRACFPTGEYRGIGIYADLQRSEKFLREEIPGLSIDLREITQRLKLREGAFYLSAAHQMSQLFDPVIRLFDRQRTAEDGMDMTAESLCRLKLLELLLYLQGSCLPGRRERQTYYPREVVRAAEAVHREISDRYWIRTPIRIMAEKNGVSETALKNCFQAVYGKPIYTYQKTLRMEKAADMLREETYPVGLIAEWTGYENAGKFSEAFRSVMGCTPREYRKKMPIWRISDRFGEIPGNKQLYNTRS